MDNSILISLLYLISNNEGKFKSEKQAKFLLSKLDNNRYDFTESYVFGEYGGCVRRVEYSILCDDNGVVHATKNGKQFFPMTEKMITAKAKADTRHAKRMEELQESEERVLRMVELVSPFTVFIAKFNQLAIKVVISEMVKTGNFSEEMATRLVNRTYANSGINDWAEMEDLDCQQCARLKRIANKLIARRTRAQENAMMEIYGKVF